MNTEVPTQPASAPDAVVSAAANRGNMEIPLDIILPSPLNPRKTFRDEGLAELGASILKTGGVIQDALVRPRFATKEDLKLLPKGTAVGDQYYQLVFGERRWRASKLVKMETLTCKIRDLDDDTALELMIVENGQREDVHPLEEGLGYKVLLDKARTVEYIAETVAKKSLSHVYARMQLAQLLPPIQEAFFAGKIHASHATEICRLQPKEQEQVFLECFGGAAERDYDSDKEYKALAQVMKDPTAEASVSVKRLRAWIASHIHIDLSKAPFDTKDAELVKGAGACTNCPKRTGSNPSLFADVKRGDTCTDPTCYGAKKDAFIQIRIKEEAKVAAPAPELPSTGLTDAQRERLQFVLHASGGAWDKLRKSGATNDQVMERVREEFGIEGASANVSYKGGPGPAVWFKDAPKGNPDLKGKDLIVAVRDVMQIPEPVKTEGKKADKGKAAQAPSVQKISEDHLHWGDKPEPGVLHPGAYELAKPKCKLTQRAIYVDGKKIGQIVDICVEENCQQHSYRSSYSSGGGSGHAPVSFERRVEIWKQRVQFVFRNSVVKALVPKLPDELSAKDAPIVLDWILSKMDHRDQAKVQRVYDIKGTAGFDSSPLKRFAKTLKAGDLMKMLVICALEPEMGLEEFYYNTSLPKSSPLATIAATYKIDTAKLLADAEALLEKKRPKSKAEKEKLAKDKAGDSGKQPKKERKANAKRKRK